MAARDGSANPDAGTGAARTGAPEARQFGAPLPGLARIAFAGTGTAARVARLAQRQPLRILLPRPAAGEPVTAVVANIGGGVVGGDRLGIDVAARPGSAAVVTTQAAEKVYRSAGPTAEIGVHLRVEAAATLEWLPQETILFDRCRLHRRLRVDAAPDARLLLAEMVVFGRTAYGEALTTANFTDNWRVRIGGRLAFADGFGLGGGAARALADPFALASARALATVLYVARDAATWREAARSLVEETRDPAPDEDGVRFDHAQRDHVGEPFASAISTPPAVRAGATLLPGLLVARWLGPDAAEVRRALGRFVRSFRAQVLRRPLPALWHV